jgi:hypothetical protein
MSANRLAGTLKSRVDVTLVKPIPDFVEHIRLLKVAAYTDRNKSQRDRR